MKQGSWNVGSCADSHLRTVDREEVDRLRKRFMKLDKVGMPASAVITAPKTHKRRTTQALSPAMSSFSCRKSPRTLWPRA